MRISLDEGLPAGLAATHAAAELRPETVAFAGQHEAPADRMRRLRLKALIAQAMDGSMPIGRPLAEGELRRFKPEHVQILLDRAAGKNHSELVESSQSRSMVNNVLSHPFTEIILSELASAIAERSLDPIERIKGVAGEMINTSLEIVRDASTDKKLRHKIASDFLDRAGYAAIHKVEAKHEHTIALPAALASRIADGLDRSMEIEADYSRFLMDPAGSQGSEIAADLTPGPGQTEEPAGASPSPSPAMPSQQEEAA